MSYSWLRAKFFELMIYKWTSQLRTLLVLLDHEVVEIWRIRIFWNVWKSSILHQSFHIHVYSIWQFNTYFRSTANGNAFKYKWARGCVQTDLFVLSFWVQVGNFKTNSFKNRQREWSYLCMSSSNKELWVY